MAHASALDDMTAAAEWRKGWPVILASFIGFGSTLAMFVATAGLFVVPMRQQTGWSVSQLAIQPMAALAISLALPFVGIVVDRVGGRKIAIAGHLIYASAYLALALLPLTVPLLYTVAIGLGLLGAAGTAIPFVFVTASWFRRGTGLAFGVLLSGAPAVAAICVPTVAIVIDRFGWRAGYLALAAIILLISLPLTLRFLFHNDSTADAPTRGSDARPHRLLKSVMLDPRLWMLTLALSFAALPMGALTAHMQPMLRSKEFSTTSAAFLGSVLSIGVLVGRVAGGFLLDRLPPYHVAAAMICIGAAGCFFLPALSSSDSYLFASVILFAIGLTFGAEVDFAAFFTVKLFGPEGFSAAFSIVIMVVGVLMSLGGIGASIAFDLSGTYLLLESIAGMLFLLASFSMIVLGARDRMASARKARAIEG